MSAVLRTAGAALIAMAAQGWCVAQERIVWDSAGATALPGGSTTGLFYNYAPGAVVHDGVEYIFYCSNRDSGSVVDHIALTRIDHSDGSLTAGREIVLAPGIPEAEQWRHVAGVWDRSTGALKLFIDGVEVEQTLQAGKPALRAFGGFRVIGGSLNPAARNTFHGRIDELRVSKTARAIGSSSAWQSPYTSDADTVDLYHFDFDTDPAGSVYFSDAASPQQDGYYFDFANPGADVHAASLAGFGECPVFGTSSGTGSRGELFPDSPAHDVIDDAIAVEAWIRPDELIGTQVIFDSQCARLEFVEGNITFTVIFSDSTSLVVSADGGWSSEPVWDAYHICDPSVVQGSFRNADETYAWALFYLGADVPSVTHNQVGVAFAHSLDGPWIKWEGNPVIAYDSYEYWGVGQPSVVNVDGEGRLLVFYSRGDPVTSTLVREVDLSDLSTPVIGNDITVPVTGLTNRDGSQPILHNASFAYDHAGDVFYVSRPRHPFDSELPSFVSSELQIASIPGEAIRAGVGSWTVLGHINSTHSGKARNHNSGILKSPFGGLAGPGEITVMFCASDIGSQWLWTYRLWRITGALPKADTTPPVIQLNGPSTIVLGLGESFDDPVTAWDDVDGDITSNLIVTGNSVDTSAEGAYVRTYNVSDNAGNTAEEVVLTVVVTGDTDGDGLPDAWEQQYFHNLDQGPQDDPDGDGVSNLREYEGGTDPTDPASLLSAVSWPGLVVSGFLLVVRGYMGVRTRCTHWPRQ